MQSEKAKPFFHPWNIERVNVERAELAFYLFLFVCFVLPFNWKRVSMS
jgi:hypothetical protein